MAAVTSPPLLDAQAPFDPSTSEVKKGVPRGTQEEALRWYMTPGGRRDCMRAGEQGWAPRSLSCLLHPMLVTLALKYRLTQL